MAVVSRHDEALVGVCFCPVLIVGGFWQQVFFADSLGLHLFELGVSVAGVVLTYLAAATVAPAVGYVQREEDRAKEQPT